MSDSAILTGADGIAEMAKSPLESEVAIAELEKLALSPGDLVVVTMRRGTPDLHLKTGVAVVERSLAAAGIKNVAVVGLIDGVSLAVADDAWLASQNLRRIDRINWATAAPKPVEWQF